MDKPSGLGYIFKSKVFSTFVFQLPPTAGERVLISCMINANYQNPLQDVTPQASHLEPNPKA